MGQASRFLVRGLLIPAVAQRIARLLFGQRVTAVAVLTWKAAFRFRLFWIMAALLLAAVVVLPLVLKHDGTARGFTQILLTYTLGSITALLAIATLWLSCGTLARDIEENQLQVVAVKPVARWQIWLGKWLGLVSLNAVLLGLAGACVFALLQWRAARLPPAQQEILRHEVLVARGSLKEPPPDIEEVTEQIFRQRIQNTPVGAVNEAYVRHQIREQVKARHQIVDPNHMRVWELDLGARRFTLKDEPLFVRLKFYAASTNALGTYYVRLVIGPQNSPLSQYVDQSLAAETFHEIQIPPNLWNDDGMLRIEVRNYDRVPLLFPLEEGFEVLYREGGFPLNFTRGLLIIFCWLALLAALGLTAASFLSFPVATFFAASILLVGFSTGTLASAVESGAVAGMNEETGEVNRSPMDHVLIPLFSALVKVFNLVQGYSPIDALSTGRSISWGSVALAFSQIVLLLGGIIAAVGMYLFTRRELAAAHSNA